MKDTSPRTSPVSRLDNTSGSPGKREQQMKKSSSSGEGTSDLLKQQKEGQEAPKPSERQVANKNAVHLSTRSGDVRMLYLYPDAQSYLESQKSQN